MTRHRKRETWTHEYTTYRQEIICPKCGCKDYVLKHGRFNNAKQHTCTHCNYRGKLAPRRNQ